MKTTIYLAQLHGEVTTIAPQKHFYSSIIIIVVKLASTVFVLRNISHFPLLVN